MKQLLLIFLLWFGAAPNAEAQIGRATPGRVKQPTLPEGKAFLVYPNPAPAGQFNIIYHLPDVSELTVSMYNVIGSEVKKIKVKLTKEKGTIEVDAHALSDGIYYIDIQAKGYRHQEKIIVL